MSLYAFHLGQIISTVLGQVDHGGQDGNAAQMHDYMPICGLQLEINSSGPTLVFFPKSFL